ncbi:MAG: hypothetical protein AAF705_08435 [Bacteroidota bacterium]
MLKGLFFVLLFSFSITHLTDAQADSLRILRQFEVEGTLVEVDPLLQSFTLDQQEYLRKYDQKGQLLFDYQNKNLGDLQRCDASNPFNILLFYQEFNTIIILDRTLNPLVEVNLNALGFFAIQLIAAAPDNKIWLYDPTDFKLKKIDAKGNLLAESQDLSLQFPGGLDWKQLRAIGDELFIQTNEHELLIFNQFGQWIKSINISGGDFQWKQNNLYILEDQTGIFPYEVLQGQLPYLYLRNQPEDKLYLRQKQLFVQSGKNVQILSW